MSALQVAEPQGARIENPDEELSRLRERVSQLEKNKADKNKVDDKRFVRLSEAYDLRITNARLLDRMLSEDMLSSEQVTAAVGFVTQPKILMKRLRDALAPYNITVRCRPRIGWYLDRADKARVNARLENY